MQSSLRLVGLAIAVALLAAAPAAAAKRPPRKPDVRVQLLAINDFHGHLEATTPGAVRPRGPRSEPMPAGGAEHLAHEIRRLRRRNPRTVLVSAGDLVGGSPLLSSLFHDEPTIEAMNRLGLSLNAVGNHELDEGANELRRLQRGGCHPVDGCQDGTGFRGARFRFLAANTVSRRTGKPILKPYEVRRFGGIPVGFIGLTLADTPGLIPPYSAAPLRFLDEARTANRYARILKRRHRVEAIVVLLHEGSNVPAGSGYDDCAGLSGPIRRIVERTTPEVDVFLTGHTHSAYNCVIDRRRVTSAGSYGRLMTRIELRLSRRTRDVRKARASNRIIEQGALRAPDITRLIARYSRLAAPLANRVIGRLAGWVGRSRDASGESRAGNLIADAMRATTGADAALAHPGAVRAALGTGAVTFAEAFRTQPFGGVLVTMTLSGAQLHELLKEQWCGQVRPLMLAPSAQLRYVWSAGAAAAITGRRCAGAASPVRDLRIDGAPVAAARGYRITISSFLGEGRQEFPTLLAGTQRAGGGRDTAALEVYLAPTLAGPPLAPPALDRVEVIP
jgi:5'-nucleotidase